VRPGVRIGVDVGTVRIGLAASDPAGLIASPVETVRRGKGDLARIARIVAEREAGEVVIGLPRSLSGHEGPAAQAARDFAVRMGKLIPLVPVRLVDERLSTVSAERGLRDAGVGGRRGRSVVDQAAAVVILQGALDAERASGAPPGQIVQAER
jgi:putative Holliday junction resolvase